MGSQYGLILMVSQMYPMGIPTEYADTVMEIHFPLHPGDQPLRGQEMTLD